MRMESSTVQFISRSLKERLILQPKNLCENVSHADVKLIMATAALNIAISKLSEGAFVNLCERDGVLAAKSVLQGSGARQMVKKNPGFIYAVGENVRVCGPQELVDRFLEENDVECAIYGSDSSEAELASLAAPRVHKEREPAKLDDLYNLASRAREEHRRTGNWPIAPPGAGRTEKVRALSSTASAKSPPKGGKRAPAKKSPEQMSPKANAFADLNVPDYRSDEEETKPQTAETGTRSQKGKKGTAGRPRKTMKDWITDLLRDRELPDNYDKFLDVSNISEGAAPRVVNQRSNTSTTSKCRIDHPDIPVVSDNEESLRKFLAEEFLGLTEEEIEEQIESWKKNCEIRRKPQPVNLAKDLPGAFNKIWASRAGETTPVDDGITPLRRPASVHRDKSPEAAAPSQPAAKKVTPKKRINVGTSKKQSN